MGRGGITTRAKLSSQLRDRAADKAGMSKNTDTALGWHIIMRLRQDRRVATTREQMRTAAATMLRIGRGTLLAFSLVDTHVHALVVSSRAAAGMFTRHVESALKQRLRLPVRFARATFREVESPWHLLNAFQYILRQDEHHGVDLGAALDGTSLQDWLACRLIDEGLPARVGLRLPRLRRSELAPWSAAPPPRLTDGDHLFEGAAATVAEPHLSTQHASAREVRIAAVHLGLQVLDPVDVADCLQLSLRSVQRLRKLPPEPRFEHAILRQVQLRQLAAEGVKLVAPKQHSPVTPIQSRAESFEQPGFDYVAFEDLPMLRAG